MKHGIAALFLIVAIFGGVIGWNVMLWNECRQTNSFWYCVRIISR